MKILLTTIGLCLFLAAGQTSAASQWIIDDGFVNDTYFGGGYTGEYVKKDGDVIAADSNQFDIFDMTVGFKDNGDITIALNTNYTPNIARLGTNYGDLFISINGWNPIGTEPYREDYFGAPGSTAWTHVFDTDTEEVYSLSQGSLITSNDIHGPGGFNRPSHWYRRDQVVGFDPGVAIDADGDGKDGIFSTSPGLLTYTFDLGELGLNADQSYDIAFRWTQDCANDIIEGGIHLSPVPEPGTMVLFGLGLLGICAIGRRKQI